MTTHEDRGSGIGEALQQAFGDEPPMMLNAGAIARQGAHALRRRRGMTIGGTVLAVGVLTAGIAVGIPLIADTVGTASAHSVPGCGAVVSTDDPAVTSWQNGTSASPTGPTSSFGTEATSSSDAAATKASTTSVPAATGPTDVYGRPVPAWLTKSKAANMATAFTASIPPGVHLAAPDASAQVPPPFAAGSNLAGGGVVVSAGSARAFLTIDVQMWGKGAPPCTANLAHRYTSADGSITDVIDESGTSETGHYMLAESYRPDGTLVNVGLNNSGGIVPPTANLPLTVQQLAAIAAAPALAITAE